MYKCFKRKGYFFMQINKSKQKANRIINIIILSLNVLNKIYKPMLENLVQQYGDLKKNSKNFKDSFQKKEYQNAKIKIIREVQNVVGSSKKLVNEALKNFTLDELNNSNMLSDDVKDYIHNQVEKLEKREIISYETLEPVLMSNTSNNSIALHSSLENNDFTKEINHSSDKSVFWSTFCTFFAITIFLNTCGLSRDLVEEIKDTSIIEDLEEFFTDSHFLNEILQSSVTEKVEPEKIEERTESIAKDYKTQFNEILAQENISMEEKLDRIIHSGLASPTNIFNFIFSLEEISLEKKIDVILHSGIIGYQSIFNYIMARDEISLIDKMESIVNTDIATFEEKYDFISNRKDLNVNQKIWYTLLIPDTSFEKTYQYLYLLPGVNEEEIIENTIRADIIPFTTLFNTILNHNTLDNEELSYYIASYNNNYNTVTLEEKFAYVQEINQFDETEKVNCMYRILPNEMADPLEYKETFLLNFFNITYDDFLDLYKISAKEKTEEQKMIFSLFEKLNEEKERFVIENYDFENKEQINTTIDIITAEGWEDYRDLYGVSNVLFNRITDYKYVAFYGINPYDQATAEDQFVVYQTGVYQNNSAYKRALGKQAFLDMFSKGYKGIETDCLEFRWNGSSFPGEKIVAKGNIYGGPVLNENRPRIIYENLLKEEVEEVTHSYIPKMKILNMTK